MRGTVVLAWTARHSPRSRGAAQSRTARGKGGVWECWWWCVQSLLRRERLTKLHRSQLRQSSMHRPKARGADQEPESHVKQLSPGIEVRPHKPDLQ